MLLLQKKIGNRYPLSFTTQKQSNQNNETFFGTNGWQLWKKRRGYFFHKSVVSWGTPCDWIIWMLIGAWVEKTRQKKQFQTRILPNLQLLWDWGCILRKYYCRPALFLLPSLDICYRHSWRQDTYLDRPLVWTSLTTLRFLYLWLKICVSLFTLQWKNEPLIRKSKNAPHLPKLKNPKCFWSILV